MKMFYRYAPTWHGLILACKFVERCGHMNNNRCLWEDNIAKIRPNLLCWLWAHLKWFYLLAKKPLANQILSLKASPLKPYPPRCDSTLELVGKTSSWVRIAFRTSFTFLAKYQTCSFNQFYIERTLMQFQLFLQWKTSHLSLLIAYKGHSKSLSGCGY